MWYGVPNKNFKNNCRFSYDVRKIDDENPIVVSGYVDLYKGNKEPYTLNQNKERLVSIFKSCLKKLKERTDQVDKKDI